MRKARSGKERRSVSSSRYMKGKPFSEDVEPGKGSGQLRARRVLVVGDEHGVCLLLPVIGLKMPGSDGKELYQRLNEVDNLLTCRVIFITDDTVDRERREFVAATGNPLIEKPFDLAELQRQLRSLFDNEGGDTEVTRPEDRRTARDTAPDGQRSAGPRRGMSGGSPPPRRRRSKSSSGEGLRHGRRPSV